MRILLVVVLVAVVGGCESAHVGMAIPVPGPIKPTVGVSVNKSGVRGTGGVSGKVGPIPVYAGGSTKPIKVNNERK